MKIGTFGGISVYIHWSFWILIAIYLINTSTSEGLSAGLSAVAFILCIFGCVVLHEFGHAGAAAAFGIPTKDITLLPIGGVARLERMPDKPVQELIIALAGPAVNLVIAGGLFLVFFLGLSLGGPAPLFGEQDFLVQLLIANLFLAIFNLLPAFPMDGGRVLRSLLAMRLGHLRATEIAARAGRWMALIFGCYGLWNLNFGLVLVGGFIFLAGTAELMAARMQAMAKAGNGPPTGWQSRGWPTQTQGGDGSGDVVDAVEVRQIR